MEHKLNLNFNPFLTLFTERLELRQFMIDDLQDYYLIRSDVRVMKALDKNPNTFEQAKALFELMERKLKDNEAISWVISLKESKKLIGYIGYHNIDIPNHRAEIGYAIFFEYHKQGIMSEAIEPVIDFAFNKINLHSIEARTNPSNINSNKLLLKHGFEKEGHFRGDYLFDNNFLDTEVYGLINPNH